MYEEYYDPETEITSIVNSNFLTSQNISFEQFKVYLYSLYLDDKIYEAYDTMQQYRHNKLDGIIFANDCQYAIEFLQDNQYTFDDEALFQIEAIIADIKSRKQLSYETYLHILASVDVSPDYV